jgi:hypothetical protein
MKNTGGKSYQPERLAEMLRGLYVYVPQMRLKGALFPVGHDAPIEFQADYPELSDAEAGDLFVVPRGRLLHAVMTATNDTIMVEMPAESSLDEQPLQ